MVVPTTGSGSAILLRAEGSLFISHWQMGKTIILALVNYTQVVSIMKNKVLPTFYSLPE